MSVGNAWAKIKASKGTTRKRINQRGAVSRRYEDRARQPFLLRRYIEGEKTEYPTVRLSPCDRCGALLPLTKGAGGISTGRDVHVHHIVARGSEPAMREDLNNLALLDTDCHERYRYDKRGKQYRRDQA